MVFCSTPLLPGRKSSALPGKPPSRKPLSFQLLCALWLSDRLQGHQIARVQSFAQTKPLCCQYFPEQEKSLALCTAQTRGALPHASAAKTYEIRNAATEFCGANSIAPISTTCPAPRNNSYPIKATPALYVFVLQWPHGDPHRSANRGRPLAKGRMDPRPARTMGRTMASAKRVAKRAHPWTRSKITKSRNSATC